MSRRAVKGSQSSGGNHAGLERKPIWKETKITFQRKALVVFPVSGIISKSVCLAKDDSNFWQITEGEKEARDLTVHHRSSGWGQRGH